RRRPKTPAFRFRLSACLSASRRRRSGPRSLSASGLQGAAWLHVVAMSRCRSATWRGRRWPKIRSKPAHLLGSDRPEHPTAHSGSYSPAARPPFRLGAAGPDRVRRRVQGKSTRRSGCKASGGRPPDLGETAAGDTEVEWHTLRVALDLGEMLGVEVIQS